MNERIKELKMQACKWASENASPTEYENAADQKFAELIVLECERVAKDPQWYGESPSNGWGRPIRHVCNVMKQHFGLK